MYQCSACKETKVEKSEAAGHRWNDGMEIKKATCEDAGIKLTTCSVCGTSKVEEIPKLPHTNQNKQLQDVTNTDKGSDVLIKLSGSRVIGEYKTGDKITTGSIGGSNKDGIEGRVTAAVYTDCAVCHNHQVPLDAKAVITVTGIKAETYDQSGNLTALGTISLEVSYTRSDNKTVVTEKKDFEYISNINAKIPDEFKAGLEKDADGVYRYYVNGVFQKDFAGVVEYNGGQFVVANGVLCQEASGLNLVDDQWYYLTEGRIRTDVTQVVMYDGEWFYVSNGKLDTKVNGLVPYDGEIFVFVDGRLAQEGNGLWIGEEGVWYFLSLGRVVKEYTGVAIYDGAAFYIDSGVLAKNYNGIIEYDDHKFRVEGGQLYGPIK